MATLNRLGLSRLYLLEPPQIARFAFLLANPPANAGDIPSTIDLPGDWTKGYFAFFEKLPSGSAQQIAFGDKLYQRFRGDAGANNFPFLGWFTPSGDSLVQTVTGRGAAVGIYCSKVLRRFEPRIGNLYMALPPELTLCINELGTSLSLNGNPTNTIRLGMETNQPAPQNAPAEGNRVVMPLSGTDAGTLRIQAKLVPDKLGAVDAGMRFFFPLRRIPSRLDSRLFPLVKGNPEGTLVSLLVDPVNLLAPDRTYLEFDAVSGRTEDESVSPRLLSHLVTDALEPLLLIPEPGFRFVPQTRWRTVNPLPNEDPLALTYLVPSGKLTLALPKLDGMMEDDPNDRVKLLMGGTATENIVFTPARIDSDGVVTGGDLIHFEPNQNAFAPGRIWDDDNGGLVEGEDNGGSTDGSGPGIEAEPGELGDRGQTSWCRILPRVQGVNYQEVSEGAPPYRPAEDGKTLTPADIPLKSYAAGPEEADSEIPLVPFAPLKGAVVADGEVEKFNRLERLYLHPKRRADILASRGSDPLVEDELSGRVTTPQGIVGEFEGGKWKNLILGKSPAPPPSLPNDPPKPPRELVMKGIKAKLRTALLRDKLFLAATDYGELMESDATFNDVAGCSGWDFYFGPRETDGMLDSQPIFIMKFNDRSLLEMAADPNAWGDSKEFNPTYSTEQVRIQVGKIFAAAQANPRRDLYNNFLTIINNPRWRGVLVLQGALSPASLPESVRGLSAGLDDKKFRAHHVGVSFSEIRGDANIEFSAFFALIDYQLQLKPNPGNSPAIDLENWLGQPATSSYRFRVMQLAALFKNGTLQSFSSKIDVEISKLFDSDTVPTGFGKPVITLNGSYEREGGKEQYKFVNEQTRVVEINAPILKALRLDRIQFSVLKTTDPNLTDEPKDVTSRFSIDGALIFGQVPANFDLFGFEALLFKDLGLDMDLRLKPDWKKYPGNTSLPSIKFNPSALKFDVGLSLKRANSLFGKFPLKLVGFHFAFPEVSLPNLGFFNVTLPGSNSNGTFSYGLRFELDLGSLGGLVAALKSFRAELLIAWKGGNFCVGLKLPESTGGRKELGIQGVMKLIIDDFQFSTQGTDTNRIYALKMQGCSVEFLGKQLPERNTDKIDVFLFADPRNASLSKVGWYLAYRNTAAAGSGFNLMYLGFGQRVTVFNGKFNTFTEVIQSLTAAAMPAAGPGQGGSDYLALGKLSQAGSPANPLQYAPGSDWFAALHFSLSDIITLGVVFNDPSLYSLFLYLERLDFSFEITYRKVTEEVGMYYIDIGFPEAWRQMEVGAASITLPFLGLSIYTNGGFRVDLGFPANLDFARSFRVEVLPFTGSGGFYVARLAGGTSTLLPGYGLVYEAGMGMKLGLGKNFSIGPFRAGISVTFYGILEGAIAMDPEKLTADGAPTTLAPRAYYLQGRFGVLGEVYGTVDFGILKATVLLRIYAGIGVQFKTNDDTRLWIEAGVEVAVCFIIRIKIWFARIEIRFNLYFHADIKFLWVIKNDRRAALTEDDKDWSSRALSWDHGFQARSLATLTARASRVEDDDEILVTDLPLYFSPEVTVVGGEAHYIVLLGIEVSLQNSDAEQPFDRMAQVLAQWALNQFHAETGTTGSVERDQLGDFLETLFVPASDGGRENARSLDYAGLAALLKRHFNVTLRKAPAATTERPKLYLATFPLMPDAGLRATVTPSGGAPAATQAKFWEQAKKYTPEYQKDLTNHFRRLQAMFEEQSRAEVEEEQTEQSALEILFMDYFYFLIRGVVDQMWQCMFRKQKTSMTDVELLLANSRFSLVGAQVSRFFRHGLRLPEEFGSPNPPVKGLYEFSEQQRKLSLPAGFEGDFALDLFKNPAADWFEIGTGNDTPLVNMDLQELRNMLSVAPVPEITEAPLRLPYLRRQPRTFALGNRLPCTLPDGTREETQDASIAGWDIWPLPLELRQELGQWPDGLALTPRIGEATREFNRNLRPADGSTEKDLEDALNPLWMAHLEFTVRRVPDPAVEGTFLPNVYQIGGADESNRAVMDRLLAQEDVDFEALLLSLVVRSTDGKSYVFDDVVPEQIVLVKTNLATESAPPPVEERLEDEPPVVAQAHLGEPKEFLDLLRQCSIVNSGGFHLYFRSKAGHGLPDRLFAGSASAGRGGGHLSLFVRFPTDQVARPYHTAVAVQTGPGAPDPARDLFYLQAREEDLRSYEPSMKPGSLGFRVERRNPTNRIPLDGTARDAAETYADLEKLYNLMEFSIKDLDGFTETDLDDSLPLGPRPVVPRDEEDAPSGKPLPDPDDDQRDWYYRHVLPVARLHVDHAKLGPYAGIGKKLHLQYGFRDIFGNRLPAWAETAEFEVLYFDPIIALAEWPGIDAEFNFVPQQKLQVTLAFNADRYKEPVGADAERLRSWREMIEKAIVELELICFQLTGPGVTLEFTTSLTPGKPLPVQIADVVNRKPDGTLDGGLLPKAIAYLKSLLGGVAASEPGAKVFSFELEKADRTHADIFELTVACRIVRADNLLDPEVKGSDTENGPRRFPKACSVETAVRPYARGEEAGGNPTKPALNDLMVAFEGCFLDGPGTPGSRGTPDTRGMVLATGMGKAGAASLWAVRANLLELKGLNNLPVHFAPRPLARELWNGDVPVPVWTEEGAQADGVALEKVTQLDVDRSMRSFLATLDGFLNPENAVLAHRVMAEPGEDGASTGQSLSRIMKVKQNLARRMGYLIAPVMSDQAEAGIEGVARRSYRQRMLSELGSAYDIDAVVQLPVEVNRVRGTADKIQPRLYGMVARPGIVPGAGSDIILSAAKVPLGLPPQSGFEPVPPQLTFLFDTRNETASAAPTVPLEYRITHIEHQIGGGADVKEDFDKDEYISSSWLNLLRAKTVNLGDKQIPVVLRQYPPQPQLIQHNFTMEKSGPHNPEDPKQMLAQVRYANYNFSYAMLPIPQDQITAEVTYDFAPLQDRTEEDAPLTLEQALVRFQYKYGGKPGASNTAPPSLAQRLREELPAAAAVLDTPRADRRQPQWKALAKAQQTIDRFATLIEEVDGALQRYEFGAEAAEVAAAALSTAQQRDMYEIFDAYPAPSGQPQPGLSIRYVKPEPAEPRVTEVAKDAFIIGTALTPTRAERSVTMPHLDIMRVESAWAGIRLQRNHQLLKKPDGTFRTTNPDFVYRTPLVQFVQPQPLSEYNDNPIYLDKLLPGGKHSLMEYMEALGNALFKGVPRSVRRVQLQVGMSFKLNAAGGDDDFRVFPWGLLLPPHDLQLPIEEPAAKDTLREFASALYAVHSERPHDPDGCFVLDLTLFPGANPQGELLLRLPSMRLRFNRVALDVVP